MNDSPWIAELHARLPRSVLALCGGGAGVLSQLLTVPGGSRWLLEAIVPYSPGAMSEFLGKPPRQACSAETADVLARRALDRARWLATGESVLGLGCTASLASDRPKKGAHRVYVSLMTDRREMRSSLTMAKGARDRAAEEEVVTTLLLHSLGAMAGLEPLAALTLLPGDALDVAQSEQGLIPFPLEGLLHLQGDGRLVAVAAADRGSVPALLPGAFNPVHQGHWAMARAAEEHLGKPVAFELSIANVDKPELGREEVRHRLDQFAGRAEAWVTRAPRFLDKARLFPGTIFVVGVDTALRIIDPRYYDHDEGKLLAALRFFQDQGCRFLVACRVDGEGRCVTRADVKVPVGFERLFEALPAERFRWDVSSSQLRKRN